MTAVLDLPVQDTAFVVVAQDGVGTFLTWAVAGTGAALVLLLIALFLVIIELRRQSRAWTRFLNAINERTLPVAEHARSAAESLDHIAGVARSQVDRLDEALGSTADHIADAAVEVRRRLADLSALLDVAQSEAEDAVLDVAGKVRALRSAVGLLPGLGRTDHPVPGNGDDPAPGHEDHPSTGRDDDADPGHDDGSGEAGG